MSKLHFGKPKPGDVFALYFDPKQDAKFFLVVAISIDASYAYCAIINSEVNPNYPNAKLRMPKGDRNYLDWDSYVDCYEVHVKRLTDFHNQANWIRYRGRMSDADLHQVRKLMWEEGDISPAQFEDMGIDGDEFDID